ncbi:hypothetical protein FA95DRAFT_1684604 [Auriscalpium vulgare]|uniref:Uncharacterized protein n=1 Tax=Auriscalpium vulgare TaxID=40419 RepID=A0ACB8R3L7_9AGAM|nr:hypothetical protein FA95DRAFT_1684604 [Auriscalpium vulgare]
MAADAIFGVDEDGNTGPTVGIVPESPSAVTHLVTVAASQYISDGHVPPGGWSIEASVGRGCFLHLTDPTIDEPNVLVPEQMWSVAVPRSWQAAQAAH